MKRILFCFLLVFAFINAIAKDINSDADWASVGPNDYVTIKMSGTTTIPSDITCKQISFEQNNTTLDLNGHTLTVENMYMADKDGLKISNGGTIHITNNFNYKTSNGKIESDVIVDNYFYMAERGSMSIVGNVSVGGNFDMKSQNGFITGNVFVGGKFYMAEQNDMKITGNVTATTGFDLKSQNAIITGDVTVTNGNLYVAEQVNMSILGSISVSGDFTLKSQNAKIGSNGATITVGGSLSVVEQTNMNIDGDVSVEGDVTMKTQGGSITGNVSVGGNLNLQEQSNMKIDGNVAVKGDLNMTGQNNNITGSAAVGGNINTSNGATISGDTTEYTGPISGGEEPTEDEIGWKLKSKTNKTILFDEYNGMYVAELPDAEKDYEFFVYKDGTLVSSTSTTLSCTDNSSFPHKMLSSISDGAFRISSDSKLDINSKAWIIIKGSDIICTNYNPYDSMGWKISKRSDGGSSDGTFQSCNGLHVACIDILKDKTNPTFDIYAGSNRVSGAIYQFSYKSDGGMSPDSDTKAFHIDGTFNAGDKVWIVLDENFAISYSTTDPCKEDISTFIDGDGCTLKIPDNKTITVNEEITVCGIEMQGDNSKLTIEATGKINVEGSVTIEHGIISNSGTISCTQNFNLYPRNTYLGNCKIDNSGSIIANNIIFGEKNENGNLIHVDNFVTSCSSTMQATNNIEFHGVGWDGDIKLNGNFHAKKMVIDNESGGNGGIIGSDCNDAELKVDELEILRGVQTLKINEIANIRKLIADQSNPLHIIADGAITIGEKTGSGNSVGIEATENSVMTLCYNPSHGGDFSGNGQMTSSNGTVIYRYDPDDSEHSWYKKGENIFGKKNKPSTEGDLVCNNCKEYSNAIGFDECMANVTNLLGIDDDPFLPKDKEIHGLYNCNPCSKEFEDTKIELHEIHGRTFRLINGEFIYCENDNNK